VTDSVTSTRLPLVDMAAQLRSRSLVLSSSCLALLAVGLALSLYGASDSFALPQTGQRLALNQRSVAASGPASSVFTPDFSSQEAQSTFGFGSKDVVLLALAAAAVARTSRVQRQAAAVKTPKETYDTLVAKGEYVGNMSVLKISFASVMGGCYVGMAGLLSLAISGNLTGATITVQRTVFAALFPINLLLVLQSGGQLFTGNTATMAMGLIEGKIKKRQAAKVLAVSWIANLMGCGLIALMTVYCHLLVGGTADMAIATVVKKCSMPFGPTLVKAIMCNWLVCMGVWLSTQAQDMGGKMVGIWFPISMFVAIGFEHSVANFFLLPIGLLAGAPLSIFDIVVKNIIPVTIGNTLAGAIIIGCGFSFMFGSLGQGDKGSFRGWMRGLTKKEKVAS
jgi:formate/nitrite transporter